VLRRTLIQFFTIAARFGRVPAPGMFNRMR
jgi:hypothetical protein